MFVGGVFRREFGVDFVLKREIITLERRIICRGFASFRIWERGCRWGFVAYLEFWLRV